MKTPKTPWGELGYITYKRTYARKLKEGSDQTEEFEDTIARVVKACRTQLNVGFTPTEGPSIAHTRAHTLRACAHTRTRARRRTRAHTFCGFASGPARTRRRSARSPTGPTTSS